MSRNVVAPRIGRAFSLALEAATRHRLKLFPLYGINRRGFCECEEGERCKAAGKHPRIVGYFAAASRDVTKLKEWYAKWPNSNYGYCPRQNGLAALDVDERNGGLVTLAETESTFGKLTPTPRCNSGSGSGSFHALFKHPGKGWKLAGILGTGIEVVTNKLLVLAGGNHASGGTYEWDDLLHPGTIGFAPFPDWALQLVGQFVGDEGRETEENRGEQKPSFSLLLSSVSSPHPPTPSTFSGKVLELLQRSKTTTTKTTPGTTPAPDGYQPGTEPQGGAGKPQEGAVVPNVHADAILANAIRETVPHEVGNRNRSIFAFARILKGIPQWRDADDDTLRAAVRQWHAVALPHIGTKVFDDTLGDFKHAWPRIKFPRGAGLLASALAVADAMPNPPECARYDCPHTHRIIRWCKALHEASDPEPFFLSCASAERALGIHRKLAWKRLRLLVVDGVLIEVERGTPGAKGKATRYRYVGNPKPTKGKP